MANVQYFEGGSLIPNKSPGRLTFADENAIESVMLSYNYFDLVQ